MKKSFKITFWTVSILLLLFFTAPIAIRYFMIRSENEPIKKILAANQASPIDQVIVNQIIEAPFNAALSTVGLDLMHYEFFSWPSSRGRIYMFRSNAMDGGESYYDYQGKIIANCNSGWNPMRDKTETCKFLTSLVNEKYDFYKKD